MLTSERIQKLASRKGVKTIAVQNFLHSVDANPDMTAALENLQYDAMCYKWNAATVNAIRTGILEHFKK
jgi:hypothetical protein